MERYDYICHHGTKGMKWGQRLYQNADGSLTPLGRLRYGSGKGSRSGNDGKVVYVKQPTKTASSEERHDYSARARAREKSIDEMTDNELNAYLNRIRYEQSYAQLTQQPKKVSLGKRFVTYSWEKVVLPAVTETAKSYVTKQMKSALGIKDDNKNNNGNNNGGNEKKK